MSDRSGGREQSKLSGAGEQVSGASERTSEWPSTYIWVCGGSGPQCDGDKSEGNSNNEGYEDDDGESTKTTRDGRLTTNAKVI